LDGKPLFEPAFRRLVFSSFGLGLSTEFIIATLKAIASTPVGTLFFKQGKRKKTIGLRLRFFEVS